jgi:hypothetical protein
MSQHNDLRDTLLLGDLNHTLSRGIVHAMLSMGGDLRELQTIMKNKKKWKTLMEGLAKQIIDSPLWLKTGKTFNLDVDHDIPESIFLEQKPTVLTKFYTHIYEKIELWSYEKPKGRCAYRLHHVDRELSLHDLLALPLPDGLEHAGWRELYMAACLMDDFDPKGYSVLALGSKHVEDQVLHIPHLIADRQKDREKQTWLFWHPTSRVYVKTTRRFYLVRDYSASST